MIIGVGTDVVSLPGFRAQLSDAASRFADGTFTPRERRDAAARSSADAARHLAARFAAKEAFVKAWSGSRFGAAPHERALDFRGIEVESDAWGRPRLRVAPPVSDHLDRAHGAGGWRTHLSLSHDGEIVVAYVVLEAVSPGPRAFDDAAEEPGA
jgi:holo-[acyl-carrier protein] synthase